MKHLLRFLAVSAALCAIPMVSQAQIPAITGGTFQDSCNHFGGSNTVIGITSISATTVTVATTILETNHGDGSKKDTTTFYGGTTVFNTSTWHLYAVPGVYTVKKVLIYSGNRVDSVNMMVTVACSVIGGHLYNDANSNCAYDASEMPMRSVTYIQVDSASIPVDTISASGYWRYRIRAMASTTYKFTILNTPAGFVKSCPGTGIFTYSFNPAVSPSLTNNFAFNCSTTPAYDYMITYARALRGSASPGASFIRLYASNNTCHSGTGAVTLQVSPKYTVTSSGITPTPSSVSGNTVTWTITGMINGNITQLYVPLSPLSTTSNGDTACNYAIITPTTGDVNVSNNVVSVCDSVRASWDPNEKSVNPNGPVSSGSLLTYTIDFENLGNDTAFNIHVQDTLSQHLDASTFALISSTHLVTPSVYEVAGGLRIIKFDFPNIKLEDKTVPTRNKGQVSFSMKMKNNLPPGTVVANRAGIYFDGNPVVLTNTAYSKIPVNTGVGTPNATSELVIYPNPVHEAIRIRVKNNDWHEATLSNALGQTISRISLKDGENVMPVQNLPTGIYYLQTTGRLGSHTEKIEKN